MSTDEDINWNIYIEDKIFGLFYILYKYCAYVALN